MPEAMAFDPIGSATMNPQAFAFSDRKEGMFTGATTSKRRLTGPLPATPEEFLELAKKYSDR